MILPLWAPIHAQSAAGFTHQNTPENLKRLMETVFQKLHVDKAPGDGIALFRSLFPDEARLKKALQDGLPAAAVEKILQMHRSMAAMDDAAFAKLMQPAQRVVEVHGATTEELAAYREGSVAYDEFPAAIQQIAKEMLRPGLMFYEVEFLEPGRQQGVKYHLVYWDGQQWSMLGPVWRGVR
jgi:hypothetical protein